MTDIEDIARRVGFDHSKDEFAAKILHELVLNSRIAAEVNQVLECLKKQLEKKLVFVTGAATSLKEDYERIKDSLRDYGDGIEIIAADGTCRYLLENGHVPAAITTDLDGGIDSILAAGHKGSTVVVLAHGDNIGVIKEFFSQLKLPENEKVAVIPVVQVINPEPPLFNFGGFTDGDRGVLLSIDLVEKVILVGFDFNGRIGPYSKPGIPEEGIDADQRKKTKLTIAREIINRAAECYPGKIWTVNPRSTTERVKLATVTVMNQFIKELAIKK